MPPFCVKYHLIALTNPKSFVSGAIITRLSRVPPLATAQCSHVEVRGHSLPTLSWLSWWAQCKACQSLRGTMSTYSARRRSISTRTRVRSRRHAVSSCSISAGLVSAWVGAGGGVFAGACLCTHYDTWGYAHALFILHYILYTSNNLSL